MGTHPGRGGPGAGLCDREGGAPSRAGTPPRVDLTSLPDEVEELFASDREELRAQIAEGVAAEERGELRDGGEAIADVRRRIDERLRRGE
jgi:hypothetical protein